MILFVMTTKNGSEAGCNDENRDEAGYDDDETSGDAGCDYDEIGYDYDEIDGDADCDDDEIGSEAALRMK